ncbi:MAG: HD domain-containing protein [Marinilabiliales bacterium]
MIQLSTQNKKKIINDPVHGFINISHDIIFDLIEHRYFQRLRRISQLGLTNYVYPGANHTRFQHALGAVHLMGQAIDIIRSKGHTISDTEAEAVTIAILLHDIGHGPFSHTLEKTIIKGISHEEISMAYFDILNQEFNNKLNLAIEIFKNHYYKKFLHQLVASQLDMDRMDYLLRDSFYSGVSEGIIGSERIIKMLDVKNDQLVVEAKGIYSVEKFLVARRLMYWQVYLHKTVIVAEKILIRIFERAIYLLNNNYKLPVSDNLAYFLENKINLNDENQRNLAIEKFSLLDDNDIISIVKSWCEHDDFILSELCKSLINRKLFKIEIQTRKFEKEKTELIKKKIASHYKISNDEADFLIIQDFISIHAYDESYDRINILFKNGELKDITEASDLLNHDVLSRKVKKYYLIYPKQIQL